MTFGWDIDRPMYVITAELDPPAANEEPVSAVSVLVGTRQRWIPPFRTAFLNCLKPSLLQILVRQHFPSRVELVEQRRAGWYVQL